MSVITIRLPDSLLNETDNKAKAMRVQRAEYIRQAIQYMNQHIHAKKRTQQLQKASMLVRDNSIRINQEFSQIEHDPKA